MRTTEELLSEGELLLANNALKSALPYWAMAHAPRLIAELRMARECMQRIHDGTRDYGARGLGECLPCDFEMPPSTAKKVRRALAEALRGSVPMSPRAREMLDAGLASARRGEVRPWDDFTAYANDPDEE